MTTNSFTRSARAVCGRAAFLLLSLSLPIALVVSSTGCQFKPANEQPSGGGGGSGFGIPGLTSLQISPAMASLTATQGGPAQTQQYTVTGIVNGGSQNVSSRVAYSLSPAGIVSISSSGLVTTGRAGGSVTITASSGGLSATAVLKVTYSFTGADPKMTATVPADAATKFTSTTNDASRAPQLVYPNDGVLFPPNVSGIEIHFTPGANNTLFEVSVVGALATFNVYVRCTTPPESPAASTCPIPCFGAASRSRTRARTRPSSPCAAPTTAARRWARARARACNSRRTRSWAASTTGPPAARPRSCAGTSAGRRPPPSPI